MGEVRYYPFGAERLSTGTTPTDYRYTGQLAQGDVGLYYYGARWYDPALGRFTQADTMVPNSSNPLSYDRYLYAASNPINYVDPNGHAEACAQGETGGCGNVTPDRRNLTTWIVAAANYTANDSEIKEIRKLLDMAVIAKTDGERLGILSLAMSKFYGLVHDGAKFDVKDNIKSELGDSIKLGDHWYEYSTPGNILYGYYGASAGLSATDLHVGAGVAQSTDFIRDQFRGLSGKELEGSTLGPISNMLDTSDDYAAIEFGFALYQNEYPLTIEIFVAQIQTYQNSMALTTSPGNYIPANMPYAPDRFNNQ